MNFFLLFFLLYKSEMIISGSFLLLTFTSQFDKTYWTCYHKFTAEKAVSKEA